MNASEEQLNADESNLTPTQSLKETWSSLNEVERREKFKELKRSEAEDLFLDLSSLEQIEVLTDLTPIEKRSWLRLLPPDDTADLIQLLSDEEKYMALSLLDEVTRKEVTALLAYAEDDAGGLMSSRFIRLRPDMSVDEAIHYLRAQAKTPVETIYYAYVLDSEQKLMGVVSFRQLLLASPSKAVKEIMKTDLITIPEDMDQEEVIKKFSSHNLTALPVVDTNFHIKGIVTVDDVVEVVKEEATEDIQRIGAVEALDAPYLKISFIEMIKKRSFWLVFLFLGEMFTTFTMRVFEKDLERALVLALFLPLIISSGGNSGSQTTSLIIRAVALGDVSARDWWRVLMRELYSGLVLGLLLGSIGFLRIILWPRKVEDYGDNYMLVGLTVGFSVVGVVLWGAIVGAMLPFILKKLKFDPAIASAPLVATLVDVTGLIIYFTMANIFLL